MNCSTLFHIKAELLCYGIQVADDFTKEIMLQKNAYVFDSGFMHAAHFLIDDMVINTCVSEQFCKKSPYSIVAKGSKLELLKNEEFVCNAKVLELPDWCNEYIGEYKIGDFIRPHSKECIACWPYLKCHYYNNERNCKFCSMGKYHLQDILDEKIVAEMINRALDYNPNYEVALSGGTCSAPDHTLKYFSNICKRINHNGNRYISVEAAPPEDFGDIIALKESGATAMIMNLEIVNEDLRKQICPGKSSISKIHYMKAYKKAVDVFGIGNVSCVLISGIQNNSDIECFCKELVSIGVVPTIIPFKPLDGCEMNTHTCADPMDLIKISMKVDGLMDLNGLDADKQQGCTKCNGCSLETIASKL